MYALADVGYVWRIWAGDAVIYDKETGDTHAVRWPGGFVLQLLGDSGPQSFENLTTAYELSSGAELRVLAETIDLLVDLGILNRY